MNGDTEEVKTVVAPTEEVKVSDGATLHLSTKGAEESGDLSRDLADLRENVRFETRVLFIGFGVIFVAVGLFIAQAWIERANSYDALLDRVDTLQAQMATSTN